MRIRGNRYCTLLITALAWYVLASAAFAQSTIHLDVDASEVRRNIIHVTERLNVTPGVVQLFYPKWIPGEHSPTGPLNNMINLHISGNGRPIPWERDDVEMFAFRVTVPRGVTTLDIIFDDAEQPATVTSPYLARVKWNRVLLYPRGVNQEQITVNSSIKVPAGWQLATALPVTKKAGETTTFGPVTLERFVDSPALIGRYFSRVPLTEGGVPHEMDIFADTQEAMQYNPETVAGWKNLVTQADRLFGAHHYNGYKFLLSLSDIGGSEGLEHHESSEDGQALDSLSETEHLTDLADLLSHEFAHSWNGKFRRPAGLATPDFEQPMKGELLWVYEGLTQYLGNLLAARSGLWTAEIWRESVADIAAQMQNRTGRRWRPLVDTARAVQFTYSARGAWSNQRRSPDYYDEGHMIWIEADVLIRQHTKGKKSLDDFLRAFHGGQSAGPKVVPYTLQDVITAMRAVDDNFNWTVFFRQRIYDVAAQAPLDGLIEGGWKLEYNSTPNVRIAGRENNGKFRSFWYSLGFGVSEDGSIDDVNPDLPGARAGISPGSKIVSVGGKPFSLDEIIRAVADSPSSSGPITLEVESGGLKNTVSLNYHGGPKYPHLVRNNRPDVVSEVLKPR